MLYRVEGYTNHIIRVEEIRNARCSMMSGHYAIAIYFRKGEGVCVDFPTRESRDKAFELLYEAMTMEERNG